MPKFICNETCTDSKGKFWKAGATCEAKEAPNKWFSLVEEPVAAPAADPSKSGAAKLGDKEPVTLSELAPKGQSPIIPHIVGKKPKAKSAASELVE